MSEAAPDELAVSWSGVVRSRNGVVLREFPTPSEPSALAERMRRRLDGERTAEEEAALTDLSAASGVSRDRRLGLPFPPRSSAPAPGIAPLPRSLHRQVLLEEAARRLAEGWDPSIHVEEAVRAVGELEHTLNLLGERLVSWAGRDAPPLEEEPGALAVVRRLRAGDAGSQEFGLPEGDPALREARAALAGLYEETTAVRSRLEGALEAAMPRRAPNLTALLGPILAARMVSQAGGLDRLARLPSSTVQVLGAERAFFEHLRGRAPPPRHGWLFLHPDVQGAPKRIRGKIARALAGKVAIAARLDREGSPVRAELAAAFQKRAHEVRSMGPGGKDRGARRPGPLRPST